MHTTTQIQWKREFSVGSTLRLHSEDPRQTECSSVAGWWVSPVEGWHLRQALQGSRRRDGIIVELTVDKSSVAGYSHNSNDVSTGTCSISTVGSHC
jgi:hypothetical protein